MAQSKIVEVEINETRNMYASVAVRGSILYFVIADMGGVDPMYQNSLVYVKSLFNKAIELSPQAKTIDERLNILITNITKTMYKNISRGLFEKDKMIYSFLIVTSIKRNSGIIDEGMWNILLRGPSLLTPQETDSQLQNPDPELLNKISWDILYSAELKSKGQYADITQHVVENWPAWRTWLRNEQPYDCPLPGPYQEQLTDFDKLILMKVFRPEMIAQSSTSYIIN
jgi:dynein heavy chain